MPLVRFGKPLAMGEGVGAIVTHTSYIRVVPRRRIFVGGGGGWGKGDRCTGVGFAVTSARQQSQSLQVLRPGVGHSASERLWGSGIFQR